MINKQTFVGLSNQTEIVVSQTEVCECYVPNDIHCSALDVRSPYLTCDRLMSDKVLLVMMWLIGLNALGGNLFVLSRRKSKNDKNKVQTFLLNNLAMSDLLMGIYMLMIASADIYFGDYFPMQAETWRSGITCRIAGTLSILSSEASVFFVTLISIDRFINIRFPYSRRKLRKKASIVIAALLWLVSLALATIPSFLAGTASYKFYDISHVCIGLPLARVETFYKNVSEERIHPNSLSEYRKHVVNSKSLGHVPGLYYSSAVFLGLNGICYFVILLCYGEIVRFVYMSSKRAGLNKDVKEQIRMTIKVAAIVLTDFFCWAPVIVLGICVQVGVLTLPTSVFSWTVTVILPINSAINPYLYTIAALISKRRKEAQVSPTENKQENTQSTRLQTISSMQQSKHGESQKDTGIPGTSYDAESNV
ncbi:G-protein coupled receptor GRL101-like [Amphiura filiformis]|uniref:G-protein coupled receptor GRL101-like n=1 Tax=Amphiura filiformis TaxID=82378 RepID=UPI003B2121E6